MRCGQQGKRRTLRAHRKPCASSAFARVMGRHSHEICAIHRARVVRWRLMKPSDEPDGRLTHDLHLLLHGIVDPTVDRSRVGGDRDALALRRRLGKALVELLGIQIAQRDCGAVIPQGKWSGWGNTTLLPTNAGNRLPAPQGAPSEQLLCLKAAEQTRQCPCMRFWQPTSEYDPESEALGTAGHFANASSAWGRSGGRQG